MPPSDAQPGRLRECLDCGLFQRVPPLAPGTSARCPRCDAVQMHAGRDPQRRAMALAMTGLALFAIVAQLPLIDLQWGDRTSVASLTTGPRELELQGMLPLAIVVLGTTMAAPLARLLAIVWVLAGLRLRRPPRHLYRVYRWVERLRPWSMIEVFLLGLFVAYTKLGDLALVRIDIAAYAMGGLMLATAAADAALDDETVWRALEAAGATAMPLADAQAPAAQGALIGCDCCGLVSNAARPDRRLTCPRCGAGLHRRKPNSLGRTLALLVAAAILYIPANLLPVMTVVQLGQGNPNTILSGVVELATAGMWPLAGLVFFASIMVPVLKLVGLSSLMLGIRRGETAKLRQRTVLYRIVDAVGRWSMIDVFMVSILTAMVRWGRFASVTPGAGVLAFCAVVILTMLAAMSFDPRLMWDAAERRRA